MKYQSFFILVLSLVFLFSQNVFAFSDIQESPFKSAIESLASQNMLGGYIDGTFRPEKKLNRVEALKMILQGSNVEVPEVSGWTGFADVPDNVWFTKFVIRAKTLGLIRGTGKHIFSPARPLTYAEALKIIVRLNGIHVPDNVENPPFPDVSVDAWYASYFMAAKNAGILANSSDPVYPEKAMIRGELAQLLYQLGKVVNVKENEIGVASFYRTMYERKHPDDTTSDEAFGTAHKTLPFGTKLKVTALDSGKSIIVIVQDRGPYTPGRVVDLSRTAFVKIAPLSQGVVPVIVERVK